ncbi:hypothetical protein BDW71DRAFT_197244 [Aspergillus fruticulosus]
MTMPLSILTRMPALLPMTHIQTEIRGFQLSQLTPAGLDQVALLAAQRGALRDQDSANIGLERQLAIARHFGTLHKARPPHGTTVHRGNHLLGPRTNYDSWHIDQSFTSNTPTSSEEDVKTEHPLVISHPVTKEPVLFVNPIIARQVVGYKPSGSDPLLGFLHDHIRTVTHSAVPDFKEGERRHIARIIPYGSQPKPL